MNAQLDLAGREHVPGLTPRQQAIWDLVRATPGGVTADEIGAILHDARGKHSADTRCRFCADEGRAALSGKALRPLLIRRRTGYWQPRNRADATTAQESAQSNVIPYGDPEPADASDEGAQVFKHRGEAV